MKNCNCTLPKHLHTKPGGSGSKLIHTTRTGICLLLLIIASLLIFPTLSHVYALQPAVTAGIGSFATEPILKTIIIDNYAPYTFVNAEGQPDGFSVALMQAVAQVMGVKLEIKVDTWDNARHALDNGTIDFLPMMAFSAERDKLYDFSPPYTIAYDAFLTRKDASPISSMDNLQGKKIIVMQSDLAHDYLTSLASIQAEQLILVDSLPEALRLLASGTGDTALMPKLVGLALVRDLNLTNLGPSPVVVEAYKRPFSFAVKDGNQAVLERLNQGMSIVKATGQYDEIYKKWFGALEPVGVTNEILLKYLGGIVLAFLLIGAVLLLWSFSLRKQVDARTRSLDLEVQKHKQLEESLHISEIELNEAQATAHIGSWKWDVAKGEITWSDEMFRIFGIDKNTYKGRLGDVITRVIHPDDLHIVLPANAANIAAGPIEYRIILPDASIRNIWAKTGATIFGQDSKPAFLTGVAQDITERKQAEEVLRQSEERFHSYFNLPLAGRAITSASAGWIDVNPTLCDMLGYTKAELMQTTWTELTHPDDLPTDLAQFKRVMAGEIDGYSLEKRFIHKDGHSIDTNLVVHCVRHPDRSVDYFVALIQDITARKQAEAALINSEERFRRAILGAPFPIMIHAEDGEVMTINAPWVELTGYQPGDIPTIADWTQKAYGTRMNLVRADIDQLYAMNDPKAEGEYPIMTRSGETRTWDFSSSPIGQLPDGRRLVISMAMDVTERKQAEEILRKSEENLVEAQQIAHIGSWQWDMLSNTVSWSKEMYQVFDINPDTHDGKPESLLKVIYPDDIELFTNSMNSNLSDGSSPALEYRIVRKDGSIHTISAIGRMEFDKAGKPVRSNGTVQDITERKLAEEALIQANERLSLAQRSSKAGVWDWDMPTGQLEWSSELLILFGLDPATPPTFDVWRSVIYFEDLQIANDRINDSIREHTLLENDYRIVLPSGELRWINALGNTTYDEHGIPQRMSGICIDITERKRSEEQLTEQLKELRRWQNITQGREDRILQLKSEINRLLIEAGKPPRFSSLNGVNLEPPGGLE